MRTLSGTRSGVNDLAVDIAAVTSDANPAVVAQSRPADTFYRMFGDAQGTGRVNSADYTAFLSNYGKKLSGFIATIRSSGRRWQNGALSSRR